MQPHESGRGPGRAFLEVNPFVARSREYWEPLGSAPDEFVGNLPEELKLEGRIPANEVGLSEDLPRSMIYETPITMTGPKLDRALEVQIPAAELGKLAFRHWNQYARGAEELELGMEMLRALSSSGQYFWEIPTLLQDHSLGDEGVAKGFAAVFKPEEGGFCNGRLSLLFRYHSTSFEGMAGQTQIAHWLDRIAHYVVQRGFTETLSYMLTGEGTFEELSKLGREPVILPEDFSTRPVLGEIIPESLRVGKIIHGNHKQITYMQRATTVRVPFDAEDAPELKERLEQTSLVRELEGRGFTIEFIDGVADFMPKNPQTGAERLSELLPTQEDLEKWRYGEIDRSEETDHYWGAYLAVRAEHDNSTRAREEALSGTLLFLYRFKDYISGLGSFRSTPDE